jgi:lanosterol synthase
MAAHTQSNGATKRNANSNGTTTVVNGSTQKGGLKETTDRTRWRLHNDRGCHIWHYLEDEEEASKWPQTAADKYFLGMETVCASEHSRLTQQCLYLSANNPW